MDGCGFELCGDVFAGCGESAVLRVRKIRRMKTVKWWRDLHWGFMASEAGIEDCITMEAVRVSRMPKRYCITGA